MKGAEDKFRLGAKDKDGILSKFAPTGFLNRKLRQEDIPALAKNTEMLNELEEILPTIPTFHHFHSGNAVTFRYPQKESIHLVVTSPPYWTLKKYNDEENQLGHIEDYDSFLRSLTKVWKKCYNSLVSGGRLVVVVGDVCLSRRNNNGRHTVVPLHAAIQESCRKIGYDNLAPIVWYKIANAKYEAGGGGFLGKPYEPNCVIKNDIEFILMFRKPGGYRSPSDLERLFSIISGEKHKKWFQQIWTGLTGASTKNHPAPYPVELAERLIRMFSFVGDVVLDPFLGTATTSIAAWKSGRNSIGIEVDSDYLNFAMERFEKETSILTANHSTNYHELKH